MWLVCVGRLGRFFAEAEGEAERAAVAELAAHAGLAAEGLGDVLDDRQAQPRPAELSAAGAVGAVEPLEHPRQMLGFDAPALVDDADDRLVAASLGGDADGGVLGAVLDRVVDQVHQRLLEQRRHDVGRQRLGVDVERDRLGLGFGVTGLAGGADHRGDGVGFQIVGHRGAFLFEAGQAQQVFDDRVEAVGLPGDDPGEVQTRGRGHVLVVEQGFHGRFDRADGGLDLVGDVGDEVAADRFEPA